MRDLIVDGYNVLHGAPSYERALARDVDAARDRLIDDIASYVAGSALVTVVFDGGGGGGGETCAETGGVRVVFTASGVTADTVIERLAREARAERREAVVVTSDAATQWTVLGEGIARMSAREFIADMAAEREDGAEHRRRRAGASTVDARVSEEARSGLLRIRDGQARRGTGRDSH